MHPGTRSSARPQASGSRCCASSRARKRRRWRAALSLLRPRRSAPRSLPRTWRPRCRPAAEARPAMPKMTFIEKDGTRREVEAPIGLSVLEIAHRNDIDLEGACEGSLACSTCHVIIDPEWYDLLKDPT